MSPVNPTQFTSVGDVLAACDAIQELISAHSDWFMAENGAAPIAIRSAELDFYVAHSRLIFACWTEDGSRTWRVNSWNWANEKLVLRATRRMGAEAVTIELIPHASAKALVASIAAARQGRCEKLAQVVSEFLVGSKIERATLSPGMRRDQPGRYARIIIRLPHERVAVTGVVASSDVRNADSLFSSALLWFTRLQSTPKRPSIHRLLIIVEHNLLEAARQRYVLLRESLQQQVELFEVDEDWNAITATRPPERKHIWRKKLSRFPPVPEEQSGHG